MHRKCFGLLSWNGALLTTAGVACSSGDGSDGTSDSGDTDSGDTDSGDTDTDTDSDDTDTDTDTSSNAACPADCNANDYSVSGEGDWASCFVSADTTTTDTCCWTSGECCDLCCENW